MEWRHTSLITAISSVPEFKLGTYLLNFLDKFCVLLTYADYIFNFFLAIPVHNSGEERLIDTFNAYRAVISIQTSTLKSVLFLVVKL